MSSSASFGILILIIIVIIIVVVLCVIFFRGSSLTDLQSIIYNPNVVRVTDMTDAYLLSQINTNNGLSLVLGTDVKFDFSTTDSRTLMAVDGSQYKGAVVINFVTTPTKDLKDYSPALGNINDEQDQTIVGAFNQVNSTLPQVVLNKDVRVT